MLHDGLKLGVTAATLGGDLRAAPRIARELHFDGILYDAYAGSDSLMDMSQSGRREFVRLLSAQDRQLVGLRFDAGKRGLGRDADIDRLLSRLEPVMETAKALGAPLVCLEAGPLPAPPVLAAPRPKITTDLLGALVLPPSMSGKAVEAPAPPPVDPALFSNTDAAMVEIGKLADRYGVIVAFGSELASFGALERALSAADCPWFGLDLDPVAALVDALDLDEVLSQMGDQVRHVRARDAIAVDGRTRPAIVGSGNVDWPMLLARLDEAGYRGWLTVDAAALTDRLAAAAAASRFLLKIER